MAGDEIIYCPDCKGEHGHFPSCPRAAPLFAKARARAKSATPRGHWFRCKCGGLISFFPEGLPPHYPPKSIGHSKPDHLIGVPDSVECPIYRNATSYDRTFALFEGQPEVEHPTEFKPMLG